MRASAARSMGRAVLLILCALVCANACTSHRVQQAAQNDVYSQPGCALCHIAVADGSAPADQRALEQAGSIIVQRLADLGYVDAQARVLDDHGLELRIPLVEPAQLPERELLLSVLSPGVLVEFHLIETKKFLSCDEAELLEEHGELVPDGYSLISKSGCCEGRVAYYLMRDEPDFTIQDFQDFAATTDVYAEPAISFQLKPEAAARFGDFTEANVGNLLAIVFNGEVLSTPIIQDRISGPGIINGSFSEQEVHRLVALLRSPALPLRLELGDCRSCE